MSATTAVIDARDHGVCPDTRIDSGPFLRRLLSDCRGKGPAKVVLAPGRYDFFAQNCEEQSYALSNSSLSNPRRCAITLRDLEDIHLELTGCDLRFHGRLMPITIDRCRRVAITGGSVDWDFPLTAQGEVLVADCETLDLPIDRRHYLFEIEDGRLIFAAEGWRSPLHGAMEFDPATGHIPPMSGDRVPGADWRSLRAELLGEDLVRLHGPFRFPPRPGHILVLRHGPRDHAGVFILDSSNIAIRRLALHQTSGLGFLCQHSEDLEFDGVDNVPSAGRMFAGHDDGIQIAACRGAVKIHNCRFAGLMDDPVNVHGNAVRVVEALAPDRVRCRFSNAGHAEMMFAWPGEVVSLLDRRSLNSRGQATVRDVKVWDLYTADLVLDRPAADRVAPGDAVENLTWVPDVTITDSFFGCCRARGVLVSTPGRVRIEGNRFESSGSAILIAGDANFWYETGAVRDVLIRGNHFADICSSSEYQFTEGVISIFPEVPHPDPLRPFHRNIGIENNTFELCNVPLLYAYSVDGLRFSGNRIVRSHR